MFTTVYIYGKTLTVTDNWLKSLDLFIEPVTIYGVRKGPYSNVIGYIIIILI